MKQRDYYIFKSGRLVRQNNSLYLRPIKTKEDDDPESDFVRPIPIPVEDVEDMYLFGENVINTKLLSFLANKNICLHSFDYYGHYAGSFVPRDFLPSGCAQLKQAEHILDERKRLILARAFVESALFHCNRNLRHRNKGDSDLNSEISEIEKMIENLSRANNVEELMGHEGNAHRIYYKGFAKALPEGFSFTERSRRPPKDPVNAIMSFVNTLVYAECLSQIYRTHLSPAMSFLHSPGVQRFSLSLDIAEIFKPLIGDRIILRMFNQHQLKKDDFETKGEACFLKESSRRKVIECWEQEMSTTIKHRRLGRNVSYRSLIRMECYKIEKHIMNIEPYNVLKAWW